jgi:hypothetical protein
MLEAVLLLSVWIGVGGWGCPSSSRQVRRGHASLPLWKTAASSALATGDNFFEDLTEDIDGTITGGGDVWSDGCSWIGRLTAEKMITGGTT